MFLTGNATRMSVDVSAGIPKAYHNPGSLRRLINSRGIVRFIGCVLTGGEEGIGDIVNIAIRGHQAVLRARNE